MAQFVKYTIRDRAGHLISAAMFDWRDRPAKGVFVSRSNRAVLHGQVITTERVNRDGTPWGGPAPPAVAVLDNGMGALLEAAIEAKRDADVAVDERRRKKRAADLKYRQARRAREKATKELASKAA